MLGLPEDSDKARVRAAMQDHVIDYAALVGLQEGTKAAEEKAGSAEVAGVEAMDAKTAGT